MRFFTWNGYDMRCPWPLRCLPPVTEPLLPVIDVQTKHVVPQTPPPIETFSRHFNVTASDAGFAVRASESVLCTVTPRHRRIEISGEALPAEQIEDFVQRVALPLYAVFEGQVVVHGVAVEHAPGRAVLYLGPSGTGKSTAAAKRIEQGARLIADDVVVLRLRNDELVIHAGPCLLRSYDEWNFERDTMNRAGKHLYRAPSVGAREVCAIDEVWHGEGPEAVGQWTLMPHSAKQAFRVFSRFAMYWPAQNLAQRRATIEALSDVAESFGRAARKD